MLTTSAHSVPSGADRSGQPAWRRALAIMLIALLSPVPALFAFWADASGDWLPDSWVDPASGHVFTLAELDAFSDDIDGDGLSNSQEMALGANPFSPDTDGDGISDLLDPLPLSVSNLSPANGIIWGAMALDDADGDGISNFLDDYPYGQYGAQLGTPDTDGDGIPDIIDPAPWDYSNWSSVNGRQWLSDALADADGDGVPNFHDWYPDDSALWDPLQDPDGDGFVKARDPHPADPYNPSPVNGLNWGPDVYGDADGDGIPNFYDAYPIDSGNGYVPPEPDSDGDGIPDSSDPSPWDYDNFSAANGVSWQADARGDADGDGISNFYDQFPYDYYNGNMPVTDMDGDGIPDAEDPAPTDPTNLSPINGGLWHTAALADADGDGNPNFTDPWPYDPTNGNLPPEWNSPTADTDGDGIANAQDPALADPLNFSIYNGTSWYADAIGDVDGDGIVNFRDEHPYDYYNGGYAGPDSDADGIPDSSDPYPNDPTNGSGGTGGGGDPQPEPDTDGDGRPDSQDPYPNDPYDNADFDHDGIPDISDPAQTDPKNLSPLNGLEWYADVRDDMDSDGVQNFWDLEPFGSPEGDFDGDGLLTFVDPAPVDQSNYSRHNMTSWPSDALGDFDGDGVPNFFDVWPNDSMNGTADADMDGIPDLSDPAPGDPMNYSSYNDRNWYGTEALGDLDNDGRLNFFDRYPEDFYDGNSPVTDPDTDGDGLADSIDPAKDDPTNFSPHNELPWPGGSANEDADGDVTRNFDDLEPYPKLPEPEPGPSCFCSWPSAPSVSASTFVLLNDNFDELTGPWTPESKRDFETDKLFGKDAEGNSRIVIEGLMPLAISLPDGYANGQRSIVIRQSGVGEVRIHAVRGNEEDCVYINGMAVVLKQGDGWQYWVEGTRAGQVTLDYEFPEYAEYLDSLRRGGCGGAECITLNYDWSSADSSSTAPGTLTIQVVQLESAPKVLAVNTNFDERKIKDGFAQPDAEDTSLQAVSGPNAGRIVTTDLHQGFFGLRPGVLPYTETAGAVVKIKKLDKDDPVTGTKQTGHVRMYAVWGDTDSAVLPIELYNPDSLEAYDLGPRLYMTASPNQQIQYYLEGVKPGKITLEFSYQKGSTSFKHEQEFLVCTQKSRAEWLSEVTEQIKLETNDNVDMSTYSRDNFLFTDLIWITGQKKQIQQVYRYYEGLHHRSPNIQLWSGLAKRAGCVVYAGLSDAEYTQHEVLVPLGPLGPVAQSVRFFSQSVLIHGGHNIFNDLAWQFRAYERSGFYALKHVSDKKLEDGAMQKLELEPWELIARGEAASNIALINEGTRRLAKREQEYILQPAFDRVIAEPTGLLDWLFSQLSEHPIPGGVKFSTKYPDGIITHFKDRWLWVENDMLPQWGAMHVADRNRLVNVPLVDAAKPYAVFPVIK
jgi:hypothetical protein